MNQDAKKIIAVVSVVILIAIAIYGSYLPMRKSQMYIAALQRASTVQTLKDYVDTMSAPLDAASPIGQEELVRNVAGTVMGIINSSGVKNPAIIPPLLSFLNTYYNPIIARGSGMSFNQNLYVLGAGNEGAFTTTHDSKYLLAAEKYFATGFANSPTRPQFIYGLFDVYRMEGNLQKTREMYEAITKYWPEDARIKPVFDDFVKKYTEFEKNKK